MQLIEICNKWFYKKNVSKEAPKKMKISKSHDNESKLTPDGRVTKLITHADTLQTDILLVEEEKCNKLKNLDEAGKDINKTIAGRLRDLTMTIQN